MLNSERSKQILSLSLPIIGGMVSQNILNLVDAAMVGFLGSAALAAVGLASFINFVAAAAFIGMAAGVQAMVARRIGEGRESEAAGPLNGALLTIFIIAIPASICLIWLSQPILALLNSDPEVIKQGTPYLQARLAGIMAMGMNFCFRGYWSAIKQTQYYFRTLIMMHSFNIVLSYILIFGKLGFPEMGTLGAGLGTTISIFIGTFYYSVLASKHTKGYGFGLYLPKLNTLKTVIKISIPSSVQQLFFAAGFTVLFWIVGKVGTYELAAANILVNITLVAILPCIAFGISAATLVGQALGRGDKEDAYRWAWDTVILAVMVVTVIGLPMILMPEMILSIFLHETEAIQVAQFPLQLAGFSIVMDAIGLVLMSALQGAGATKDTMLVSLVTQWGLFLPVAWYVGPVLGLGLTAIWLAQFVYRGLQAGMFILLWQKKSWADIKLA